MKMRESMELDQLTSEGLLEGTLGADDVATQFAGIARLLEAARIAEADRATAGDLIEKMSALVESSTPKSARNVARKEKLIATRLRKLKLSALAGIAALGLMTGLAFAGALPDQVQNAAAKAFEFFGFDSVPTSSLPDESTLRGGNAEDGVSPEHSRTSHVEGPEVSQDAQEADSFSDYTDLADDASGGASEPGTSTAEQWVPEEVPTSGEGGQSTAEGNQSTGEEASSAGPDNQNRNPR